MRHRHPARLTALLAMLVLGACSNGSATVTTAPVPGDTVLLRYSLWGGCNVAYANCPVYTVHADGAVEVGRNTVGAPSDPGLPVPTEVTGRIPAADVAEWVALADRIDPDELLAELGPGECNSCIDGADILVIVHPGTDREIRLDSTVVRFDPTHPLFATLTALADEFAEAAPLPVVWPEQPVTS